ncbi:hypothetical protein SAICODRAFT_10480 [Saitoella complicata NRRL Y-17804]|uniref:SnoaL-like domain-containing protein n=1 Tax=Saitoella complicata (strain BCRC 22490 / CBS 7301 / JCM 7358 / NBRC 10748 / NRRL Y-17804) TaxID=698492 RepID=A0A0E9NCM8_SAICN|nr:uncharacterized protein SAICODRAFT_10480 [Saitoella complicata NRRL Y-17804]ODQ49955.1 hypothetical protein SAICODRAFT_10480 [Saitoella complicata NRRL Y-17804]GAO47622.1 hypothetical protein G7K_1822-t1 [Saitoella complicata NRRL Y-17804]
MASPLESFITAFYKTSDDSSPAGTTAYVNYFTPTATATFGLKSFTGTDALTKMREGMWAPVSKRHHVAEGIYTVPGVTGYGEGDGHIFPQEVMIRGKVTYTLAKGPHIGEEVTVGWAARMVFDDPRSEEKKMKEYTVWLDSTPLLVAQGLVIRETEGSVGEVTVTDK